MYGDAHMSPLRSDHNHSHQRASHTDGGLTARTTALPSVLLSAAEMKGTWALDRCATVAVMIRLGSLRLVSLQSSYGLTRSLASNAQHGNRYTYPHNLTTGALQFRLAIALAPRWRAW